MRIFLKTVIALTALTPAKLFACAACFGGNSNVDGPLADGMNWAIFTLGAVLVTVLGAFGTFLVYTIRKSEALEAAAQKNSLELSKT